MAMCVELLSSGLRGEEGKDRGLRGPSIDIGCKGLIYTGQRVDWPLADIFRTLANYPHIILIDNPHIYLDKYDL